MRITAGLLRTRQHMVMNGFQQSSTSIRQLGYKARNALQLAMMFLKPQTLSIVLPEGSGCKWHLFLDQPADVIETCAISLGITSLIACGEPIDSELMRRARLTLFYLQLPNGGWTSWVNELHATLQGQEDALILDTFYALRALKFLGETSSEAFRRGFTWMRKAHNPLKGGWGFYENDDNCYILPTSYAIRILVACYEDPDPVTRAVINRGIEWLVDCCKENPDGVWGRERGSPSSTVHTALALMALVEAGIDEYSPIVVKAREWLLTNIQDMSNLIDYYLTPGRDSEGRKISSRAIHHINFHGGLVLQGLLIAGTNLLDPRLLTFVEQFTNLQMKEGYWRCPFSPREQPIFAISDACLALKTFSSLVKEREIILEPSERIQVLDKLLTEQIAKNEELMNSMSSIQDTLQTISQRVDLLVEELAMTHKKTEEVFEQQVAHHNLFQKLDQSLFFFKPLLFTTLWIRKFPWLSVLILLLLPSVAISAYSLFQFGENSKIYVYTSFIISFILILITIVTFWDQFYRNH